MRRAPILTLTLVAGCLNTGGGGNDASSGGADLSATASGDLATTTSGGDLAASNPLPDLLPRPVQHVYVGGYGATIKHYRLESSGALTALTGVAAPGAPSFLAVDPARRHLYAVDENGNSVAAFAIDPASGNLTHLGTDVSSGGSGPAHLSVDGSGKTVFVANYGDGAVATLPINSDGSLAAATAVNHDCPGTAHQAITDPSHQFLFVPCVSANVIRQYSVGPANGTLTANPPYASGIANPRHLAFRPGATLAYAIEEATNRMDAFTLDGAGHLALIDQKSTLPPGGGASNGAEVQVHPSGNFVYGSNRPTSGDGTIVEFSLAGDGKLTTVGFTVVGAMPRHFSLTGDGRFLLVADQGSNDVRVFGVDATSGKLSAVGAPVTVPTASFVGVVPLP